MRLQSKEMEGRKGERSRGGERIGVGREECEGRGEERRMKGEQRLIFM